MGLVHIFGNKPIPQILDFLRVYREWDYSLKTISEATGLSFRTLQRIMPQLVKEGLILKTRTVGKSKMYIINKKSTIVKKLDELALEADVEYARSLRKRPREIVAPVKA